MKHLTDSAIYFHLVLLEWDMPFFLFAILYSPPLAYSPSTSFITQLKVRIEENLKIGEYQDTFFLQLLQFLHVLRRFFLDPQSQMAKICTVTSISFSLYSFDVFYWEKIMTNQVRVISLKWTEKVLSLRKCLKMLGNFFRAPLIFTFSSPSGWKRTSTSDFMKHKSQIKKKDMDIS